MSKVTLTFNMPEDKEELRYAQKGFDHAMIIDDLFTMIRAKLKYDDTVTEEQAKVYHEIREFLLTELKEREGMV